MHRDHGGVPGDQPSRGIPRQGEVGAALGAACPACGFPVEPGSRFCGGCGRMRGGAAPAPRFTAPEAYTPRHIAERILTARGAMEGERKQVTRATAERALALARAHQEHGYEGWVLRMLGEVAARSGETERAAAHFRAVLAVAEPRGMRALEAHAWAALGRLARAAGDHAEAERLDAAAATRAARLGMVVAR